MKTGKPVVVMLDWQGPENRAIIEAESLPEVELRMVTSRDPADLRALVADAAFFVGGVEPIPASLIESAPGLRLIHKWGVGVDKIDLVAARARGVPVAVTAGANAVPAAEFTVLLMLAVLRRLVARGTKLRTGEWQQARADARADARRLGGKIVGLVGMGAIGREVAKRVRAFEAGIRYFDPRRLPVMEEQALGSCFVELEALLPEVDILSLHVPLVEPTRHLLSRERIARLKPGAIVINTARGAVVDEEALAEALENGRLGGAGIDVFSTEPLPATHPLLGVTSPGLVLTPHVAGSAFDNVAAIARHAFANIRRVLRGEPLPSEDLVSQ